MLLIVNTGNYLKTHSKIIQLKNLNFYFNYPSGMGDAVLKFKKSKFSEKADNILLIWGDIPFIKKSSIDKLIRFHISNSNFRNT